MNFVKPHQITTLVVSPSYEPHDWVKARDAMRLLCKGACRGFDANGMLAGWEPAPRGGYPFSWRDQTVALYNDQPMITSGGRQLLEDGQPHAWAIPTVLLIRPQDEHLGMFHDKTSPNSVEGVWKRYDKKCVFCGETIPLEDATRDHYFPQGLGGPNTNENIVLSCKRCNSEKGMQYPWLTHEGVEPKIRPPMRYNFRFPHGVKPRPEWNQFLYFTPKSS